MKTYDDLTPDQRQLHQYLEQEAGASGADLQVLIGTTLAPAGDKAAVAEVFGGDGAGEEFLR